MLLPSSAPAQPLSSRIAPALSRNGSETGRNDLQQGRILLHRHLHLHLYTSSTTFTRLYPTKDYRITTNMDMDMGMEQSLAAYASSALPTLLCKVSLRCGHPDDEALHLPSLNTIYFLFSLFCLFLFPSLLFSTLVILLLFYT